MMGKICMKFRLNSYLAHKKCSVNTELQVIYLVYKIRTMNIVETLDTPAAIRETLRFYLHLCVLSPRKIIHI